MRYRVSQIANGRFEAYAPSLKLRGTGDTRYAATADLFGTIESLWREYKDCKDDELAPDAIVLRAALAEELGRKETT